MTLRTSRNVAFLAMIVGWICLGTAGTDAEGDCQCCTCTSYVEGTCEEQDPGVQGMTNCNDAGPTCTIYGHYCTPPA
jgi:hypothetical protein